MGDSLDAGRVFPAPSESPAPIGIKQVGEIRQGIVCPPSRARQEAEFNDRFQMRRSRHVAESVFLMLGSTDAAAGPVGRGLNKIIDSLAETNTALIPQTPPPARPDRRGDASVSMAYVEIVRDVATERHVALIDHWLLFEQRLAEANSEPDWWSAGGQLPNVRGHVELARQVVEALSR